MLLSEIFVSLTQERRPPIGALGGDIVVRVLFNSLGAVPKVLQAVIARSEATRQSHLKGIASQKNTRNDKTIDSWDSPFIDMNPALFLIQNGHRLNA